MKRGVPASKVLGHLLYIIELLVVGDVLKERNEPHHNYAADSLLFIAFIWSLKFTVERIKKVISQSKKNLSPYV